MRRKENLFFPQYVLKRFHFLRIYLAELSYLSYICFNSLRSLRIIFNGVCQNSCYLIAFAFALKLKPSFCFLFTSKRILFANTFIWFLIRDKNKLLLIRSIWCTMLSLHHLQMCYLNCCICKLITLANIEIITVQKQPV